MIENHVISLEVARKLKSYLPEGFESEYYYERESVYDTRGAFYFPFTNWKLITKREIKNIICSCGMSKIEQIPAPLLTEMLELLPKEIGVECTDEHGHTKKEQFDFDIQFAYPKSISYRWYSCSAREPDDAGKIWLDNSIMLPTAAAKLYMWLVDNDYIKKGGSEK